VVTGTPVRLSLLNGDGAKARDRYGIGNEQKVLLVTGGSLGAEGLNRAIIDNIQALTERFFVIHICGAGKTSGEPQPGYVQLEFVDDGWGDLLAAADLVVSRAGANALFEWVALRKPNLLVPLPLGGSRGDQLANATFAKNQGWSEVVDEGQLSRDRLLVTLDLLMSEGDRYRQAMAGAGARDAAATLLGEIQRLMD
jgi:UDP-N-acetylglucosamine--N-acetylmuramyl-(pentapeptide) pyrophosphoryl-undecaprenol N-acetylglucosamine transferase